MPVCISLESTPVENYEKEEDEISFSITLKDLIESETEYMLVFLMPFFLDQQ